jgi:hypothetical protein
MERKSFLVPEKYVAPASDPDPVAPSSETVALFLKTSMQGKPVEWQKAIDLVIKQYRLGWAKSQALVDEVDKLWNPSEAEPEKESEEIPAKDGG